MTQDEATAIQNDQQSASYGQPVVTGKRVRLKDGREGEIDRVAMGDGTLYVWFGQTQIPDHDPALGATPMRVGVEEMRCEDATLIP